MPYQLLTRVIAPRSHTTEIHSLAPLTSPPLKSAYMLKFSARASLFQLCSWTHLTSTPIIYTSPLRGWSQPKQNSRSPTLRSLPSSSASWYTSCSGHQQLLFWSLMFEIISRYRLSKGALQKQLFQKSVYAPTPSSKGQGDVQGSSVALYLQKVSDNNTQHALHAFISPTDMDAAVQEGEARLLRSRCHKYVHPEPPEKAPDCIQTIRRVLRSVPIIHRSRLM